MPTPPRQTKHASLLDRVGAALSRCGLSRPDTTLVVGVSGGPDSVALLDLLHHLSAIGGPHLHVAHLDHQLRPDSPDDAAFVAALAARLGIPVTTKRADVGRLARERRVGIEEAARDARYELFAEVATVVGAAGVALGHTADDQVETILLALIRGSGPAGLRGMQAMSERHVDGPVRSLRIVRPLLETTRAEIEDYLRKREIAPRRDPTNEATEFRRNRVRHVLLPALRELNPRVDEAIRRLGRLSDEDERYFEAQTHQLWPKVAAVSKQSIALSRDELGLVGPSLSSRLLRKAFSQLLGDSRELEAIHVEAALRLLEAGRTGSAVDWPRSVQVRLDYESLVVELDCLPAAASTLSPEPVELSVPGTTRLPTGGSLIACLTTEPCRWEDAVASHADLDFGLAGPRLVVRRRRPGDRLVPLGMRGEKKVQDLLVDARVPRSARDRVPIVEGSSGIVWVAGVRADERYRVGPATRAVLCLRLVGGEEPDSR